MEAIKRVKEWRVGVSIPLPIVCETIALPFELTPQIPSLPQLRRRGGRAGRWPVRTGNARRSATAFPASQPVRQPSKKAFLRPPGIEPRSPRWQRGIMPLNHRRVITFSAASFASSPAGRSPSVTAQLADQPGRQPATDK